MSFSSTMPFKLDLTALRMTSDAFQQIIGIFLSINNKSVLASLINVSSLDFALFLRNSSSMHVYS